MKKDTTTIKRILRQTDNTNLHGYFQNENNFIICNGYSIIKFDMNNIDFIADIDNLNNNTNKYYNYKSFNEHITKNQDVRNTNGSQTIEILVEDLKMWKKHGKKGKPFIIATKKGFMGLNPCFLLDLASLTRQDKNKLIKIKVLDKKAPLYIDGNGVKALLCPVVLNKTDFNKNDYIAFLDKLADCYDLEKAIQEENHAKKANKVAGIMPTLQPNKNYNGYTMSFYGVDYFILSDAKRITKSIITEFVKAYCKRNNFSDAVLNDMLNSKIQLDNIKARIEKATFILYTNADNSAFTYIDIKTKYAFNGCMYFECDNKLVLIDCVLPTSTETKEETPKIATIQDNAADIVADPETTNETTAADVMSANNTDKANNDSVTATQDIKTSDNMTQDTTNNAITTETMQADARQTETTQDIAPTTQDKPHKTSKKAISLFVVTDKPAPVKLYGANIPTLERIPTYTQRIISRFKPSKMQEVYNTRVDNEKSLKKAYNDFVGTASMSCDKCAISGDMVAVNSS